VIGDAVNIASRLEGANKLYGSDIIIGPETRRLAGNHVAVRELDRQAVYGRSGGLQIYELLGMAGEFLDTTGWVQFYEAGLASYRARDFTAAIRDFEKAKNLRKQDQASSTMIEHCEQQLKNPVGDDKWDGTTVARTK
jgi:adenylate cyclase